MAKTVGIIVNPWAGIGGKVALKGSDGEAVIRKALSLGAVREAPDRAAKAIRELSGTDVRVVTCRGDMGETSCAMAGIPAEVLDLPLKESTGPEDTVLAAKAMLDLPVDLLLFAGGDGTARDVCGAVGESLPVLGIPAGVKIHSAVFAKDPRAAGRLAARFLAGGACHVESREVMDIDEEAYRNGELKARLYGYMQVPYLEGAVQKMKDGSASGEADLEGIGEAIAEQMDDDCLYIIGAGTTTRAVTDALGLEKTLLGVDVIQNRKTIAKDVTEKDLQSLLNYWKAKIVITPIGGQGYLFGRGNQQLSAEVLRRVGVDNILVIATQRKMAELGGQPFSVDLEGVDFPKFIRVYTGYRRITVYPIS